MTKDSAIFIRYLLLLFMAGSVQSRDKKLTSECLNALRDLSNDFGFPVPSPSIFSGWEES